MTTATQLQGPPPTPIAEIPLWSRRLREISRQPLTLCPDFPRIARRYEAWWAQEVIDRPLFIGYANPNPARPIDRRLEHLFNPDRWLREKLQDVHQVQRAGDALPWVRVDFGPVLMGGLLGGEIEFGSDTTWTHAFINDEWSNAPDWTLREDHHLWKLLLELLRRTAQQAAGNFLVCTPDLGGSADVLLNLRGSEGLCLDALERPELVRQAIEAIYPAWHRTFSELYRQPLELGAGVIHWLTPWSDQPYMIPACDFNYMIGPEEFSRICLPDIERQALTAGRAVFHLDGPGAARHIDALLEVSAVQAIQFTPGEGTRSVLAWVPMFRKIQRAGRSVLAICPPEEVLELCAAVSPRGLCILLDRQPGPAELEQLFEQFCRLYGASEKVA